LERRSRGDYREDENLKRFPEFVPPSGGRTPDLDNRITFDAIIDAEVEHRRLGIGAKHRPLPEKTVNKYRRICREFDKFRQSTDVVTVKPDELEAWIRHLIVERSYNSRTVNDRVGTIKTIVRWGVARLKHSGLRRVDSELELVELPGFTKKPSDESAIKPDEAIKVLSCARQAADDRLRWLPWLCAYTGARIGELEALETSDFREVEGQWFFKISTSGGRSVKTQSSIRYVPVHPALEREGFIEFVKQRNGKLFSKGANRAVIRWFRSDKGPGIKRKGVSPNHGWRHLFEDLCIRDGVSDAAKVYITGRYNPGSAGDYGKTLARLPGLYREMAKIKLFDL
jgi:integrase